MTFHELIEKTQEYATITSSKNDFRMGRAVTVYNEIKELDIPFSRIWCNIPHIADGIGRTKFWEAFYQLSEEEQVRMRKE